jgi:protein SCO1/2
LIYFGYTFCPDVCPLDTARNAEAVDILEGKGLEIKPVFISFDPQRDTPQVLRDFTDMMHPRMIGLSGSPEQVKAASLAYKTFYQRQDDDPDYYLMDHSTFSYFMMPEQGFVDFFDRDLPATEVADRMACFVEAAS